MLDSSNNIITLSFNETWYCPVRCPYCYITKSADLSDRTSIDSESIISSCLDAREFPITEYRFSGGEPTSVGDVLFDHARLVFDYTKTKPSLLTSGFNISDSWCSKARNLFSNIFISIENPLMPFHNKVDIENMLNFIRANTCDELPLLLGLTLIHPDSYDKIFEIFNLLYDGVGMTCFPQLSSPSLMNFIPCNTHQLNTLEQETFKIFAEYGVIPYYFSSFIGSLIYSKSGINRFVINLNPNGTYSPYDSLSDSLQKLILQKSEAIKYRKDNCNSCEWQDLCNPFHENLDAPLVELCSVRKSVFSGIYRGLFSFNDGR